MLIDWFTVVAEIVNFLILLALMKRYLWGPLLKAMDDREARIAGRIHDAEQREREAADRARQLAAEKAQLEDQCAGILEKARRSADAERGELMRQTRTTMENLEHRWTEELDQEQAAFLAELRRRAAEEILDVSRKALRDLAGADLETSALHTFLAKVESADLPILRTLASGELTAATAMELPPETKDAIREAVSRRLGRPVDIVFQVTPSLAWGIELRGSGERLGWTSDSYLNSLQQKLEAALAEETAGVRKHDIVPEVVPTG